jgi:N-methylhydantoinase B/oxoprolinase/acetone carboxylase alpha subunit
MWHHKNKYHENKKNNDQKMTQLDAQNEQCMTKKEDIVCINKENETDTKLTDITIFMYCNKKLSAYTHMRIHLKT